MSNLLDAAWQALDALDESHTHLAYTQGIPDAIAALRTAIAEAEKAHPPKREPLTDQELLDVMRPAADELLDHIYEHDTLSEGIRPRLIRLGRLVLRAHGIGCNDE